MFSPFRGELSDPQSGAIDEAFADVVAALVDTYKRGGVPASATWTIAEIWTNDPTKGIRSMSNPKAMEIASRDWFPARKMGPDQFASHDNSSIMSHAFKLMANPPSGGFHVRAGLPILDGGATGNIPSLFVPGLGPSKTWTILFETFRSPTLRNFPDLPKVRTAAVAAANLLYGAVDADAVDRAFLAVGVGNNCTAPPPPPQVQAVDRCPKWILRWPVVPGATVFHGQRAPQALGWLNPTTIVDGNVYQCTQQVSTYTQARVRACNGCGCSAWSQEVTMFKWPSCP
jgi:hypothetical protein